MPASPVSPGGELAMLEMIAARLGRPPEGEVWVGDDAAVLRSPGGTLLFATDAVVEGVHFARATSSLSDAGWKALASNISDLAAMGGQPVAAVVSVCGANESDLDLLYRGITECSSAFGCPVVGGDLSDASELSVTVAVIGSTGGREAVLRSGGRPGDRLFVTAPLGASAAGLRLLRADPGAGGELVDRHRRPQARVSEGCAAAELGATAMMDLSDGLGIDVDRLARASHVGVSLSGVPVADGATEDEAIGGGEDYELLFAVPPGVEVVSAFKAHGLPAPIEIGELVAEEEVRLLRGELLDPAGYRHGLSGPRHG